MLRKIIAAVSLLTCMLLVGCDKETDVRAPGEMKAEQSVSEGDDTKSNMWGKPIPLTIEAPNIELWKAESSEDVPMEYVEVWDYATCGSIPSEGSTLFLSFPFDYEDVVSYIMPKVHAVSFEIFLEERGEYVTLERMYPESYKFGDDIRCLWGRVTADRDKDPCGYRLDISANLSTMPCRISITFSNTTYLGYLFLTQNPMPLDY